MRVNKLTITSKTGHFGKVLGYDDRFTYISPPPSTVIGMLQTIYNKNIDNFIFGYTFKSKTIFKDDITIHKRNMEGKVKDKGKYISNIHFIEMHYDCELNIYTNIDSDIEMNYILCMGKAGNIARLHFPIETIELTDKEGQGFNQYTPINIGKGIIQPYNLKSEYIPSFNSYDHQVRALRFNQVFNYNKQFDETTNQNIFLWEMKNGKVDVYND